MSNSIVNDLDLQALADGELEGREEARVRAALCSNPVLKTRYEQLERQRNMIALAWAEEETDQIKGLH